MMGRFVRSFPGNATGERWYDAGAVVMRDDRAASEVVANGGVGRGSPPRSSARWRWSPSSTVRTMQHGPGRLRDGRWRIPE